MNRYLFRIVSLSVLLMGCSPSRQVTLPVEADLGDTWVRPTDGATMIYVPEGEFLMGSEQGNTSADKDEKPQHMVYVDSFWVDQTEVTNAMYAGCVDAGECDFPSNTLTHYGENYFGEAKYDDYPVISMDWFDALAYCEWVGQRLPTEAEWEKAARGTDSRMYPWGGQIDCEKAQYIDCGGETVPVGSYPEGASPYGVLDMAGNMREWVSSLYQKYPYDSGDGREDLQAEGSRLLRGGSWHSGAREARSSDRMRASPSFTHPGYGFRCAGPP